MRDLLIALCGLTPQVVTETLWALRRQQPAVLPREIRIVTTGSGKQVCDRLLFGKHGKLGAYLAEYAPGKRVRHSVITLTGVGGAALEDLRTQEENLAVANQLATVIRDLTSLPQVRLHCSIAGGRKTMGVLLASVLQVYGRPGDRLYHVLVSPEFESLPEFFYIPKHSRLLTLANGKRLDTRQARIELAEVPYVRLRAFLPEDLLKESLPFTELVDRAQKHLRALEQPQPVKIDVDAHALLIGNTRVSLSPAQARLYTAFARIKTEDCAEPLRKNCDDCNACYRMVSDRNWDAEHELLQQKAGEPLLRPSRGDTGETLLARFRSLVTKTNSALAKALGSERLAARYQIRSDGPRGETRYGLATDKTLISQAE